MSAPTYTVNSYTSVVPVYSRTFSGTAVVLLSTTTNIGQLVTIRDMDGHLSTPKGIRVSTTGGAILTGGSTSLTVSQRFSYVTLRSAGPAEWTVINTSAFEDPAGSYSMRGMSFSTAMTASTLELRGAFSTAGAIQGHTLNIVSTARLNQTFYISSLTVGNYSRFLQNPTDGFVYDVSGSLWLQSSAAIVDNLSTTGFATLLSSATISSTLSVGGSMTVSNGITFSTLAGSLTIGGQLSTANSLTVRSTGTITGSLFASTSARFNGNVFASTVSDKAAVFNTVFTTTVTQSTSIHQSRSDIAVVSPTYTGITTPVVEVLPGLAARGTIVADSCTASTLRTGNLLVIEAISCPTLQMLNVRNATILNPTGSLVTSSIQCGYLTLSNTLLGPGGGSTIPLVNAQTLGVSTLSYETALNTPAITVSGLSIAETTSADRVSTGVFSIVNQALPANTLAVSSVFISSAFIGTTMSLMTIPHANIQNTGGKITCSTLALNTLSTATSLQGVSYFTTPQSTMYISTSGANASTLTCSSVNTGSVNTSSLIGTAVSLGVPLTFSTFSFSTLYVTTSTISGVSTNTQYDYVKGLGTRVEPVVIQASLDRTVELYTQNTEYLTVSTAYVQANLSYRNDGSLIGTAGIRYYNPYYVSTLLIFNAGSGPALQKQVLSNYAYDPSLILSTNRYMLQGPTTYLPPSTVTLAQTIIAGGVSEYEFAYSSDAGQTWAGTDRFTMTTCIGLAWGGDKWLAAGQGSLNTLAYSYNGVRWFGLGKGVFTSGGAGAAFNGSLWVAVGSGTNSIATSVDGVTWTGIGAGPFSVAGAAVAWSGSLWVAVGAGTNSIAYSANGVTWTGVGTGILTQGTGVAWNGSLWVATGFGANTVATSADGMTWTGQVVGSFLTSIAWNGGKWLAGSSSAPQIYSSSTGFGWTGIDISASITGVNAIVWAGTQWVATGAAGKVVTSADGVVWSVSASLFSGVGITLATQAPLVYSIARSPLFIATGGTTIARSANGTVWSSVTSPFTSQTTSVAYNGQIWVAGGQGTYSVAYSADGVTWTGVAIAGMTAVASVAWGAGKWVAVGTGANNLAVSADGITWTPYAPATSKFFSTQGSSVAWGGGIWAAAGGDTGIAFSATGLTWSIFVDSIFTSGTGIAFNGSVWVAVGTGPNSIAYSVDGFIWVGLGTVPFTGGGRAVAYNGSRWVAVGAGTSTIAYSFNGIDWIGCGDSIFTTVGTGIVWSAGKWIATGEGTNTLATSEDGVNWIAQGLNTFPVAAASVAANAPLPVTARTTLLPTTIRWTTTGVCVIDPITLRKPDQGVDGWNAAASSQDGFIETAFLQFRSEETVGSYMMGLSENPTASTGYETLNYSFFINVDDALQIWELGTLIVTLGSPSTLQTSLQIVYDGVNVVYKVNSVAVRTVARSPGAPLFAACSIKKPGTAITSILFQPLYRLETAIPVPSTTSYAISQIPGNDVAQFQPIEFLLTSNIPPCRFIFNTTLAGTIQSPSTLFYADVYINSTLYASTNIVNPTYGPVPSTYQLYFSTVSTQPVTPGDIMYVQYKSTRSDGDLYLYGSYLTASTTMLQDIWNPYGINRFEFFHTNGNTGLQTSQLQWSVSATSNDQSSYVDSNYGIEMNMGYIVWRNALNGITIENQFNDIRTRSLLYTGAIYNPSDSNLKTDIEYADTAALYKTLDALPLRRYGLRHQYMNTFGLQDRRQIGVVTSDVAEHIPDAVHEMEFGQCGLSTLQMVEKNALQFTHFGATQELMGRVSTLSATVKLLKTRFKIPLHFVESGV